MSRFSIRVVRSFESTPRTSRPKGVRLLQAATFVLQRAKGPEVTVPNLVPRKSSCHNMLSSGFGSLPSNDVSIYGSTAVRSCSLMPFSNLCAERISEFTNIMTANNEKFMFGPLKRGLETLCSALSVFYECAETRTETPTMLGLEWVHSRSCKRGHGNDTYHLFMQLRNFIFSRQESLARQAFFITPLHGARYKTGKNAYAKK